MQDKWFGSICDYFSGQLRLLKGWVDHGVLVVFKDAEEFIQAHIDRRWLDHRLVEGFDAYAACGNFASNIAITK
jgi:hypothetical protein